MKNTKELRELSLNELEQELLRLRKEQFTLRLKRSESTLDKTHLVRAIRRNIAVTKTIMTEKVGLNHVK